jgi:cytidylate kinase
VPVVAIDGPAGAGKSTVARAVADRLGLAYLDTGAMYRAVALAALRRGVDPAATDEVAEVARTAGIEITTGDGSPRVVVDGADVTGDIRSPEVTRAVSAVAANPAVRGEMVRRQREWASAHQGAVVEGRDIGTVVFPDADLKVFLTATDDERARRRALELVDLGYEQVAADLARRDRLDSSRAASPLKAADGAVVLDTTGLGVEEVVERILERL